MSKKSEEKVDYSQLNIYRKIIAVKQMATGVTKDGAIRFGRTNFDYASSNSVLSTLNPLLNEIGLVLIPEITDQRIEAKNNQLFTVLEMTFTWINADNPEETIKVNWSGQGFDSAEKGIGKALTYAEKYFMLKFFNLPTDQDDPDYVANQEPEFKKQTGKYHSMKTVKTESKPESKPEKKKETKSITGQKQAEKFISNAKNRDELRDLSARLPEEVKRAVKEKFTKKWDELKGVK